MHVIETMRLLPITPLAGAPGFVLGVSIIRGEPVPVVELDVLVGVERRSAPTRLISLRVHERRVALAVEAVAGVQKLDAALWLETPPILANTRLAEEIGVLDAQLLLTLETARLLPPELWAAPARVEP